MSTVESRVAAPPVPALPAAHRGLFGAAGEAVHGSVQPTPYLRLDDVDIASGLNPDGSWPGLMVVEGLSVTWGRAEVLAQPTPATAQLSLFDPTGVWAAGADVIGKPVHLRWELAGTSEVGVFFRGRIASVAVTPKVVQRPDGSKVSGALVDLQCTSLLTDLGNRLPYHQWPAETFAQRTARLASLAFGPVLSLTPRDYWQPAPTPPIDDAENTNALEQLELLFNSSGCDRMVYNTDLRQLDWLGRRHFPNASGLAYLAWNPALRTGCYITALGVNRGDGIAFSAPMFIDSRTVEYDAAITKDMSTKLTRTELTYQNMQAGDLSERGQSAQAIADQIDTGAEIFEDFTWHGCPQAVANHNDDLVSAFYAANPGSDWPGNKPAVRTWLLGVVAADRKQGSTYASETITTLLPSVDERVVGERTATVTTMHADAAWAQVCAGDLTAIAAGEASGWGMEPMRWDTTGTGGFETLEQARLMLAGYEHFSIYFLSGSWLPQLGIRPVFGIMGGTIGYARRGWQVQWHNAPVSVTEPQQYEITWDHCDAGDPYTLVWDEDDNPFGLHSSVTWEDLQYVSFGFGVTSIPTDGA